MEYGLIIGLILFYFYTVTCAYMAVQIAAVKGRRRAWGWLAVALGLVGVAIVCFLPNKKGVRGNTNPILTVLRRISGISPVAIWIVVVGVLVVAGGALLGSRIVTAVENRTHEKELTASEEEEALLSPAVVRGEIASLFCGQNNNFVVTKSGDLYGWGKIDTPALDESGKIYQKAEKVCAAGDTLYVLGADHALYAKGGNQNSLIPGQKKEYVEEFVRLDSKVKDMAISATVGAILKENGNLYVFGVNTYGQLGCAEERINHVNHRMAESVEQVVITNRSLYYRLKNGEVYAVGNNAYGQFGRGNQEACGTPVKIAKGCKSIAAGDDFAMILKKDGTVYTAGNNACGQLGRITAEEVADLPDPAETGEKKKEEEKEVPVSQLKFGVVEMEGVADRIAAGGSSAYLQMGETLYGWGDNLQGQLGSAGKAMILKPQKLHSKTASFAVNGDCLMVLTQGGKLLGAGDRQYRQLGVASGDDFAEIADVKEAK